MKSFEDFNIELCVFELRYTDAFMLWDVVGSVWTAMISKNPSLKVSFVQPNKQVFETEALQLAVEISVLRVTSRGPQAIDEVAKNASWLTRITSEKAKIDSFKRAGFRLIQTKPFSTSKDALRFANIDEQETSMALGPDARKVGFTSSTRFETERNGLQAILKLEERDISFTVPWESRPFFPASLTHKEWILVADVDYYTIGTIEQESLDVETWVRQASKAIQRHWSEQ